MIHSIVAIQAFDEANKSDSITLRCPHCRSKQTVEEKKLNQPLLCENCGTEIPSKQLAKSKAKEKRAR